MGSCKYIPLLIVFITPGYIDWGLARLLPEEDAEKKFTANEDTQLFHKQIKLFGKGYGTEWIVMPDGNDTANIAIIENDAKLSTPKRPLKKYTFENASNLVTFHFFKTKREEDLEFQLKDIHNIDFASDKPTKFIFHGWMASSDSSIVTEIRDAYLAENDVNVIGVDWSPISKDFHYLNSAAGTQIVGRVIGYLIDSLVRDYDAQYDDFHLIGHSLGAHVAGFAGSSTRGKVGRITGLDPALPGFEYTSGSNGRLDESDAEFVDVIHTCSGVLGMSTPVGHVDFYPNGGSVFQPGCVKHSILHGPQACSHSRAHQFFAESISKSSNFKSVMCQDWNHFKKNKCDNVFTVMGEHIPKDTKHGVYYLKTNWESPFSRGLQGIKF